MGTESMILKWKFQELGFVFNMLLEEKLIGKQTLAEAEIKD